MKNLKKVESVVSDYFNTDQTLNQTANLLIGLDVGFTDINNTIQTVGEKLGFIVTPEKLKGLVSESMKSEEKPDDYYRLIDLANKIEVKHVSFDDLLEEVAEHFQVKLKPNSFYKRLLKEKGHHGTIGNWLLENPEASCSDLMASESGAKNYLLEVAGYMQFFKQLEGKKAVS